MYLYVWVDGSFATVHDNITAADLLGVQMKTLRVFRKVGEAYQCLVIDNEKLCWAPVQEARTVSTESYRLHVK